MEMSCHGASVNRVQKTDRERRENRSLISGGISFLPISMSVIALIPCALILITAAKKRPDRDDAKGGVFQPSNGQIMGWQGAGTGSAVIKTVQYGFPFSSPDIGI